MLNQLDAWMRTPDVGISFNRYASDFVTCDLEIHLVKADDGEPLADITRMYVKVTSLPCRTCDAAFDNALTAIAKMFGTEWRTREVKSV